MVNLTSVLFSMKTEAVLFWCLTVDVCILQLIQTISAVDTDEPLVGQHKFVFSISASNPNFTIIDREGKIWSSPWIFYQLLTQIIKPEWWHAWSITQLQSFWLSRDLEVLNFTLLLSSTDNTANILTRRGGFSRREMSMYFLPVVISDNDYPIQSSTSTLIVRVCACDSRGNMQTCNPEVLPFSDGLTTGALVAILLCVIILLSKDYPLITSSTKMELCYQEC